MAITFEATINRYIGLSSDTKPTVATYPNLQIGSVFFEYDTGNTYITYDNTNWALKGGGGGGLAITSNLLIVKTTKVLAAASQYHAEDVLSESASAGTIWTFTGITNIAGGNGEIISAKILSGTTNVTPRITVYLFKSAPTVGNLNDHGANTVPVDADVVSGIYVDRIDFDVMEDLGGDSGSIATPSTKGNLPITFKCAAGSKNLLAIVVTRDAFTQTATNNLTIILKVRQY